MKKILNWLVGLAVIAVGVYIYWDGSQTDKRFTTEAVAIAQAVPTSSEYTEKRGKFGLGKRYQTDLGFTTASGQTVRLNDEYISEDELAQLKQGTAIEREYLVAEPEVARAPGQTEPVWPAWVFVGIGLFIGFFGLGWKEEEKSNSAA